MASMTTRASLNNEMLSRLTISYPSLPEQQSIAEVLSSLDDKIDLLHRNNKTLEEMAETLFRQWFVEGAKEDWEMGTLGELVLVKRGGSPRPIQDFLSDSGLRWLKISDVTSVPSPYVFNIKEYIKEEGIKKTVLLKKGSLIVSNSATPGIPKILAVDSCIHDGWLYFPESQLSNEFLYLFFLKIKTELVSLGNGSIFTNLKTDIVKTFPILKPDAQTLEKFDDTISPVFKKMYSNTVQLLSLTETRDVLLPKLMSGQVRVKH
jgi:type I restriction enzyme S subunit